MFKTIALTCTLALISLCVRAQLVIIEPNKGYAELRNKPGKPGRIVGHVPAGSICMLKETSDTGSESPARWNRVGRGYEYPLSDTVWPHQPEPQEGYMLQSQYKMLDSYPLLPPGRIRGNCYTLEGGRVKVTICTRRFKPGEHRITRRDHIATAIDGRFIWGTDGGIPATEISSMVIEKGGQKWELPPSAFRSVYQPDFNRTSVYQGQGAIYITMAGGDGSGTYYAVWTWKNKALASTTIFAVP